MKFILLLVVLNVRLIIPSDVSDSDGRSDSSPEGRIFRALSRSSLPISAESASRASFSDPGSDVISIPGYLSSLGNSAASSSSSSNSSSFHSDSESEKCALSDRELLNVGLLYQVISNKLYGSSDFQKNVYSALDLYQHPQIDFNPAEGKTLGDLLRCLYKHQEKIDVHDREHTLALECIGQENEQRRNSLQRMQDDVIALQAQISGQESLMHEQKEFLEQVCGVVKEVQQHMLDCQQEIRTLASLVTIMQEGHIIQKSDKSEHP